MTTTADQGVTSGGIRRRRLMGHLAIKAPPRLLHSTFGSPSFASPDTFRSVLHLSMQTST
ncbi:hypothetical protein E2C01_083841 [Portunus trituberculatus]|uniref:Uncharacterized protein n=1 Tax=Portunus trituberculatus TaxID=210409 RepID=A0A5B7J5W9_PORTR|nr:hypothetical protein [Portunus trituberculatus]